MDGLAQDMVAQVAVTGSMNPLENHLFGAILHDSPIADKIIVY